MGKLLCLGQQDVDIFTLCIISWKIVKISSLDRPGIGPQGRVIPSFMLPFKATNLVRSSSSSFHLFFFLSFICVVTWCNYQPFEVCIVILVTHFDYPHSCYFFWWLNTCSHSRLVVRKLKMKKQERRNEPLYVCSNLKYTEWESRTSSKSRSKCKCQRDRVAKVKVKGQEAYFV